MPALIGTRRALLTVRPDLLFNGNFNEGAAGWTVNNADVTHIVTFAGGTMRFQSDTTSPTLIVEQNAGLVAGRLYAVETWCSAYVSGSLKIDSSLGATTIASSPGYRRSIIQPSASFLSFTRNSANVDLTLDVIRVTAAD